MFNSPSQHETIDIKLVDDKPLPEKLKYILDEVERCKTEKSKNLNFKTTDDSETKLDEYNLYQIPFDTFDDLNLIEEIDLTSNKLRIIPSIFLKFPNLKILLLNRNEIETAPSNFICQLINLEELNLRFNNLNQWPSNINKLMKLKKLNLGYNKLKEVSFGFFENLKKNEVLINLEELDLSSNYMTQFPTRLTRFTKLKNLQLNNNELKTISNSISNLKLIEDLGISKCSLNEFPISILELKNLKKLNLVSNENLKSIPNLISTKLLNLEQIDVSRSDLLEINSLFKIKSLIILNSTLNKIVEIPDDLSSMSNLTHLDLSKNQIKEIPDSFQNLKNLKYLNMSNNQIKKISQKFENLENLIELKLFNNEIDTIETIKKFKNLEILEVGFNKIKNIDFISNLKNLKILKVENNEIKEIPKDFNEISNLELLDFQKNILEQVPDSLFEIKSLKYLNFDHNLIQNISKSIENLSDLNYFSIKSNELETIPKEMISLSKLEFINISQNSPKLLDLDDVFIQNWEKNQNVKFSNSFESPNQIIDGLFLGSYISASNRRNLKELGITHILNVAKECVALYPNDFTYLSIPMSDSSATNLKDHFPKCFEFMDLAFEKKGCILVHCVAGVSRSASTVIAYIMTTKEERYDKVYEFVHSKRSLIQPNPSFGKQLRQYDKELILKQ
eukprot:gene10367-2896_t